MIIRRNQIVLNKLLKSDLMDHIIKWMNNNLSYFIFKVNDQLINTL